MEPLMVVLILLLLVVGIWILFSPSVRNDFMYKMGDDQRWTGEDIQPEPFKKKKSTRRKTAKTKTKRKTTRRSKK